MHLFYQKFGKIHVILKGRNDWKVSAAIFYVDSGYRKQTFKCLRPRFSMENFKEHNCVKNNTSFK